MNHIMLDLETLGNKSNAAIVSIGAVEFDMHSGELGKEFYCNVNPSSSAYYGGQIEGQTVMWWLRQSDEARKALMKDPKPLKTALEDFTDWFPKGSRVWGNGATFDNVILSNAFDSTFKRRPWGYRADMDMRTIVALGEALLGIKVSDYERVGTHHNALDDSIFQAKVVSDIFMKLKQAVTK